MGVTIDERVVEMRFDNKQFEAGAKQSLSTLQRLKEALNFSSSKKSLGELQSSVKGVDLTGIQAAVDSLNQRFSTMGIVGMRVITNIVDSIQGKLGKAIGFIQDSIIQGGIRRATNIEKARFQLQSIIGDEIKVQAVLDAASDSVNGTAYSFDVAAKAASQFYASGITDSDTMAGALRGLAGATATFSADYESMAMIWAQVAGKGRLMGDELLQLSSRGMNAAATIAKYMNNINNGSIEASDNMKAMVQSITGGLEVTEGDIREFTSKGKINFEIFSQAMSDTFGDAAKKANETFDGSLANIKAALARIGAGFVSPLVAQNSKIVELFNSVREKVNDVKAALVFDEQLGNVDALSKQFSDGVLNMAGDLAVFVKNLDIKKPMDILIHGVESVKNVVKGFGSILKPVGKAFRDIFLKDVDIDLFVNLAATIEKVTAKFKLSEKSAKNLGDAFGGVFSVARLLLDIVISLIKIFIPFTGSVNSVGEGLLSLIGMLGRGVTAFTEFLRSSKFLQSAYTTISKAIKFVSDSLKGLLDRANELTWIEDLFEGIGEKLVYLGEKAAPYIEKLNDLLIDLRDRLVEATPEFLNKQYAKIVDFFSKIKDQFQSMDASPFTRTIGAFTEKIKEFLDVILDSDSIEDYIKNLKEYFKTMKDGFGDSSLIKLIKDFVSNLSFDKLDEVLDKTMTRMSKFVDWVKKHLGPAFEGFSIGGAVAAGGGIGLVYVLLKLAKSFEKIAKGLNAIPNLFGSIKDTLKAYQEDLKADRLLKISKAIAILAGAVLLLSFAKFEKVIPAVAVLGAIAYILEKSAEALTKAAGKGQTSATALNKVADGIKKSLKNLSSAVKYKAIGDLLKSFGTMMLELTGSIVALALMYERDSDNVEKALLTVGIIASAIVGVVGILSLLGSKLDKGVKNLKGISSSMLMLTISLKIVVSSMKDLFKMEIPEDYQDRLLILGELIAGIGALAIAVGIASRKAGDSGGLKSAGTILALCLMIKVSVSAINDIFEMDLPEDYKMRLGILGGIFAGIGGLMYLVGEAARIAGGKIKAAGTILAMCVMIGVIVGALGVLTLYPKDKMLTGAIALGGILIALGKTLKGAGKVVDPASWKTVLAMAIATGVIVAALGILSLVPFDKLLKSVLALGSVLLVLAKDFEAASKVKPQNLKTVGTILASIVLMTGSLYVLSQQPWERILAAAGAMSATLLSFAKLLKTLSSLTGLKPEKIKMFLTASLILVPITAALYILAYQPWDGLLAAGVALSATLLAFAEAFKIISSTKGIDIKKIGLFLTGTLAIVPIAAALYILSEKPWKGLLVAAQAICLTLTAFSAAFVIIGLAKPDMKSIAAFLVATTSIIVIAGALYILSEQPIEGMLNAALAMSEVLLAMVAAFAVCTLIGAIAPAALSGIVLLDLFIANWAGVLLALGNLYETKGFDRLLNGGIQVLTRIGEGIGDFVGAIIGSAISKISESFVDIGKNLSGFADAASPFFEQMSDIDASSMQGVKVLCEAVLLMTGAQILKGLSSFLGMKTSFVDFGKELAAFGPYLRSYANSVKGIDASVVETSANAAKVLAEMAKTLPNSGGLAAKILGDNSLAQFGRELALFGPYLKSYANSVAGISEETVSASVAAASSLAAFATELPNTGGLVSLFTGDNSISTFGADLAEFGRQFKMYYDSISGVAQVKVSLSISCVRDFIALSKEASGTDMGGMRNLLNTMSTFGGEAIGLFIASFNGATPKLTTSITNLVSAGIRAITAKNGEFTQVGTSQANNYLTSFKNKYAEATSTGQTLATRILSILQLKVAEFGTKGTASANSYLNAIKALYGVAVTTGLQLATNAYNGVNSKTSQFSSIGHNAAQNFVSGLQAFIGNASGAGKQLANAAHGGVGYRNGDFYGVGRDAGKGFVNGLNSMLGESEGAGARIANAAYNAARRTLREKSPSKRMFEVGDFAGIGFIKGLIANFAKSYHAGEGIAENMVNGLKESFAHKDEDLQNILDIDLNPTITPKVDLTNVVASGEEIASIFNQGIKTGIGSVSSTSQAISRRNATIEAQNLNAQVDTENLRPIEYKQYISSPKYLSRIDIYRQTKNLLNQNGEVVNK